jgi:hypothetical protein
MFVGLAAGLLIAAQTAGGDDRPVPDSASAEVASDPGARPTATTVATPEPLLIAPGQARPGEVLTLVAYQRRGLCGGVELLFDGAPVDHQVTATIDAPHPEWNAVILTLPVASAVAAGPHELALFGPMPGGRGGLLCADQAQHRARIAAASVVVSGTPS